MIGKEKEILLDFILERTANNGAMIGMILLTNIMLARFIDVLEPADGHTNSPYCKEDMIKRKVPCIVVASAEEGYWTFEQACADEKSKKYCFGDNLK